MERIFILPAESLLLKPKLKIAIYVHSLEDDCYYVGITKNIRRRDRQHNAGQGSVWTKLHPPIGTLSVVYREVSSYREGELMENAVTIEMMLKYGWRKVRGGNFCQTDEKGVEQELRAYGYWDAVFQASIPRRGPVHGTWIEEIQHILTILKQYHLDGCPSDRRELILSKFHALRNFPYWSDDFLPVFNSFFWDKKGILPVLLSIRDGIPIGSKLQDTFAVLCAAMQKGSKGKKPWNRLFLITWQTYLPQAKSTQQDKVNDWYSKVDSLTDQDRSFDPFVSIAFPETRWLIRSESAQNSLN